MRWRGWALTLKMLGGYLISTASSGRCGFLSGYCFRVDFRIAARRWIPSFANSTSQYVLNSGWLCYCTPWVLNPGQIRGWPRIRCLQTDFCWAITILWCSLSLFNFALCALLHCQALPQLSSATPSASLDYWQRARKCGSLPLLEEVSCCSLQVCVLKQLLKADTWPVYH